MGKEEAVIIWFTGQPGSGKTTLAELMQYEVGGWTQSAHIIDGDLLRAGLVPLQGDVYGEQCRRQNIDRAQSIALSYETLSITPIVAVVAPYRDQRERFKAFAAGRVLEVYLHTTELRGRENYFVENYEPPLENFLDLDTGELTTGECIKKVCTVYRTMATVS